jgi:hypothetical protein
MNRNDVIKEMFINSESSKCPCFQKRQLVFNL